MTFTCCVLPGIDHMMIRPAKSAVQRMMLMETHKEATLKHQLMTQLPRRVLSAVSVLLTGVLQFLYAVIPVAVTW